MPLIPPPPQTQALNSTTFRPPLLDGSLSIPEIYEWQAANSPNHRIFVYANDDGSVRNILWPEAVAAIHTGASLIQRLTGRLQPQSERPVIAILAAADTLSYFTLEMSIMRANCIAFPISPRNSAAAVAHLISKVDVQYILVGREQAMQDLASAALQTLTSGNKDPKLPKTMPIPSFEDLFSPAVSVDPSEVPIYRRPGLDEIVLYLHSSGSTAFPKPISWKARRFFQLALIPWFGGQDLTGTVWSIHVMPMFHGMGVCQLCWTASCGLIVAAFEPKIPAVAPTPDGLFTAAKASNSDVIFCVPSFIEAWARNPSYVEWLATRTGVLYGGGPLNREVGDFMTSKGVSIFILYGSTEGGVMSPIIPAKVGYDWDYFEWSGLVTAHMIPYGDGTFEFVMGENEFCHPGVLNTKIDGRDAYASSDLFTPHPTKPGYWRVYGRTDDQIMHNTGEKTNPGPLESLLNQDPHVLSSVMFGRGRFQAGVVVDLRPPFKFDLGDPVLLAEARNKIWPTIEKMNEFAPQHSRLFKEMIIFSSPDKPFTYTAKNTARRQAILITYSDDIDKLYDDVEETTQADINPPLQWDLVSTRTFVEDVVLKALKTTNIQPTEDIFQLGCDSLQATWIRNSILRALRASAELDTRKSTRNFVYGHPTINALSQFTFQLAAGQDTPGALAVSKVQEMQELLEKHTGGLEQRSQTTTTGNNTIPNTRSAEVVLVSGTTGALGSHILASLVAEDSVTCVYALNRHNETPLAARQEAAFKQRGLSVPPDQYKKIVFLEVDFAASGLGLDETALRQIENTVTHIIHNAWRVDFNLALHSFESNIRSVRSVIDIVLASPSGVKPSVTFISSIGIFQNPPNSNTALQEAEVAPEMAVGTGYAESKWVAEAILKTASNRTGVKTCIVRVGQLSGGENGVWNTKEWFPSLVQASGYLGYLPTFTQEKVVSWVPVSLAGKAIGDIRHASWPTNNLYVHLVLPHPPLWSDISAIISSALNVNHIDYQKWAAMLQAAYVKSQSDPSGSLASLNAFHLLPFYDRSAKRSLISRSDEAFGFPLLASHNARNVTPMLAGLKGGTEHVMSWLEYWRQEGLLSKNE